ncbi:hypothetical protein JOC70_002824 [Clostridium pascui]|uniref:hypothetical protein n=1 Tax=Clostridium pascui TaxID=46609 RepID=UPI00195BD76B|nr:hypothetical protein [Clostridium pascui]MBM7871326.1 hypothetical protein [Clostridium pascui]
MSKVMSILEKYNLVEKVSKEKSEYTDSELKNNIKLDEAINNGHNVVNVEANDYKEEVKVVEPVIEDKSSTVDNNIYKKKMTIDDIYSLHGLENSNINTVFMLQNLINALPQNLPKDIVKQSVINIIDASRMDLNKLLSDGDQRLNLLDEVIDCYYKQTNNNIAKYKEEIAKLSSLINDYQEQIKINENMLEEQIYEIKYESQKIGEIINFFSK